MKRRGKKPAVEPAEAPGARGTLTGTEPDIDDIALFHEAVRDVAPLPAPNKVLTAPKHLPPIPRKISGEERPGPDELLSDNIASKIGAGDEWAFLRPGLSSQTLRRLRRGYWEIQAQFDLHGLTRDEARQKLVAFLGTCAHRGFRCVRVIHGKGLSSPNREPVLKTLIGGGLSQRDDVLAFCQARPEEGGSGAVLVLLRASARRA